MSRNFVGLPSFNYNLITGKSSGDRKKRKNISFTEKAILWERNKNHTCHICKQKIHSLTEAQVDHVRAHSKGGQQIAWAHSSCNRLKGNKPLSAIHKRLGIYKPTKRKTVKKRKSSGPTWYNPLTGKRERFRPF